ncbi:hypothetical protein CPB85DRAFT_1431747 [Mucidula mucida]|nr:hypothetical protein CPB85DRAFT_1431747 [Mucidula mucida]
MHIGRVSDSPHSSRETTSVQDVRSIVIRYTIVFNGMHFVAFAVLCAILITALFSKHVRRTSTWHLFIMSWMLHCVTFFLILGKQYGTPEPSFGICLTQAALLYATPVFNAVISANLAIHVFLSVSAITRGNDPKLGRYPVLTLMVVPPFLYVAMIVVVAILGLRERALVQRDGTGMFCNLSNRIGLVVTSCFVVLASLHSLFLKNRRMIHRINRHSEDRAFVSVALRIGAFSLLPIFALGIVFVLSIIAPDAWTPVSGSKINLVTASLPLAAGVAFGTQKDIIKTWMFWRPRRGHSHESSLNIQIQSHRMNDLDGSRWTNLVEDPSLDSEPSVRISWDSHDADMQGSQK